MTELSELMDRATRGVAVPIEPIVARATRRGKLARRRRRALTGVGSVAAVAVLGAGGVWVGHSLGSGDAALPSSGGSITPLPPQPTETHMLDAGGDVDASLAMNAFQIHEHLAGMFPTGDVGPILTQAPYSVVSEGRKRVEHFTYDGSLVSFTIGEAAGRETCASRVLNGAPNVGYGQCESVGDATVLTEVGGGAFALNTAIAWHHGYEVTVMSYAASPSEQANPAMDGKPMQHNADQPPLSLDVLKAAAASDAWFA